MIAQKLGGTTADATVSSWYSYPTTVKRNFTAKVEYIFFPVKNEINNVQSTMTKVVDSREKQTSLRQKTNRRARGREN